MYFFFREHSYNALFLLQASSCLYVFAIDAIDIILTFFFFFCYQLFYGLLKKSHREYRNAILLSVYSNKYFCS